jgi:hypothetical protein
VAYVSHFLASARHEGEAEGVTTCRGRTRVLAFVRAIERATLPKRRRTSRSVVARQAFTLAEQADIVSAWKQGARALRHACERFAVSYDAVVNLLEENVERRRIEWWSRQQRSA